MHARVASLLCPLLWSCLIAACSTNDSGGIEAAGTRLFIDTDLPTPQVASRVRVDVFDADGTWIATRDVATESSDAFPVSFDVAAPEAGERSVRVRVRVYPEGRVRAYRGERFADWPAVLTGPPDETSGPRLLRDGVDETPENEPQPAVTVDRLLRVTARAGEQRTLGVVLRGACAGAMSDLEAGTSCVTSREEGRSALAEPSDDPNAPTHSNELRETCDGVETSADRVCVPGGVLVLGEAGQYDYDVEEFLDYTAERLVRVHRFVLDRDEIDVARYRALEPTLLTFARYTPVDHDGPLGDEPAKSTACTYTSEAGEREHHPLNCLPWGSFRQLCTHEGGDLPTEVQWEYAAALAGGTRERRFPWGDEPPTCDRAVYARIRSTIPDYCTQSPALVAIDDPAGANDVTPLGVRGLAGSLTEYVQDAPAGYTDPEWTALGWDDPRVDNPIDPAGVMDDRHRFVARGGSWASPSSTLPAAFRLRASAASPFYGARCAYPVP